MHKQPTTMKSAQKATKASKAKKSVQKNTKRKIVTKKKVTKQSSFANTLVANGQIAKAIPLPAHLQKKQTRRSFSTDRKLEDIDPAEIEAMADFEHVQRKHAAFTTEEKDAYNAWLFAKMTPILRRQWYAALAVSRIAPSQPEIPDNDFMIEDLVETLTAHSLLIPIDSKIVIPESSPEDYNAQVLDDLMFVLETFDVIPKPILSRFKKGYINPNIEFAEGDFATNPFDAEAETHLTPEEIDQDGPIYTVADAIENTLKMAGFFDIIYFQHNENDAELQLPPQPPNESAKTNFSGKTVKLFPFHEDENNPFVAEADDFAQTYLDNETNMVQLLDYHTQFYRHDVVSTLHPEVQEMYEQVVQFVDGLDSHSLYHAEAVKQGAPLPKKGQRFNLSGEIVDEDEEPPQEAIDTFKGVIRDFYLQTSLYQNYLSDPDPRFPFFNINMDYDSQMKQLYEYQEQEEQTDGADDAFINDKPSPKALPPKA